MKLGLHVSDFRWAGAPATLGPTLASVAQSAEAAGFERLTVMDHLWQIALIGPPEQSMLEAYATLGFIVGSTSKITVHTMVTATVYREPGLLAKIISTLDVLSGGRMMLGIGAGWFEEEAAGLGLTFPPLGERFERLEETLQICLQMWSDDDGPYAGRHFQLARTLCEPRPVSTPRPRIMVGGAGERKTLALVAKYADSCNIYSTNDVRQKLGVLRQRCEEAGRDYDAIEKTSTMLFDVGPDGERVPELLEALRALHDDGMELVYGRMHASGYTDEVRIIGEQVIPVVAEW